MQYTTEELQTILDLHKKWLYNSEEGKYANLSGADLIDANLRKADMSYADLRGANLRGADLIDANLRKADMSGANLRGAALCRADLGGAYLRGADLRGADLRGADLCGANLCEACLREADMSGAKNVPELEAARLSIVPESGSFIGYKKAYTETNSIVAHPVIVKLEIAADAKRSNGTGRKCRCSKANVVSITDVNGASFECAYSRYDSEFVYEVGKTVEVDYFDDDRWEECAPGIHFFITRAEAENY